MRHAARESWRIAVFASNVTKAYDRRGGRPRDLDMDERYEHNTDSALEPDKATLFKETFGFSVIGSYVNGVTELSARGAKHAETTG
jgi:hypothetical protein